MRLADGRLLGLDTHNPSGSRHLFYCHGTPGARVDWELFDAGGALERLDLCVHALDRPGMGASSPAPGRRLVDWAQDVAAVAGEVGAARFAVLGYSGGGPYALACAAELGERVSRVALAASLAPVEEGGNRSLQMARDYPLAVEAQLTAMAVIAQRPLLAHAALRAFFAGPDRRALVRREVADRVLAGLRAAFVDGSAGAALDMALLARPWGFELARVRCPVRLYHGEEDRNVPAAAGRTLARLLPDCRASFLAGEGHISLLARHGRRILEEISEPAACAG